MTNTTEVETTEVNKTKKKDIFMVDPRSIIFNAEENPRKFYGTPAEKKELRESIRTNGVEVPLKIMNTPEGPKLIHGFRRMDAVMSLIAEGVDIKYVKCEPVGRGYSEEDALLDHIVLNSGRPLTPMEQAGIFKALINLEWTQVQIAERTGMTQSNVSNILKLADLPMKVQNMINNGQVSSTMVLSLLKTCGGDHKKLEAILETTLARFAGKNKVTEKDVTVAPRPSKYHRMFTKSIEVLQNNEAPATKIHKVEAILAALDSSTPEELAEKLLEIV